MHIHSLYVYPIKSLRAIPLASSSVSVLGLDYDRTFLLQRAALDTNQSTRTNLHIGHVDELCLFTPSFLPSASQPESMLVRYTPPKDLSDRPLAPEPREITVPLRPSTDSLRQVEVVMHRSGCKAWDMGPAYASFFTECLGFEVQLLYLGNNTRRVLGNMGPTTSAQASSLLGSLASTVSGVIKGTENGKQSGAEITFADCAPLLVASLPSLKALEKMVPEDGREGVDMTKFRPNIVVASDEGEEVQPWEEDFWAELEMKNGQKLALKTNCARCKSVNVNYATGSQPPPAGQTLKAMMKDRRVDVGMKYSPVFGRYGYLESLTPVTLSVGDAVKVGKRNTEHGVFYWPGLSVGTRNV